MDSGQAPLAIVMNGLDQLWAWNNSVHGESTKTGMFLNSISTSTVC